MKYLLQAYGLIIISILHLTTAAVKSARTPWTSISDDVNSAAAASSAQEPCAQIASAVADKNFTEVTVPALLAWQCLQSVPIQTDSAVTWLESIKPYIRWQSNLAYLADPPQGYVQPAIDVYARLDDIIANTKAGNYSNEYDLEIDLYELITQTHDPHFYYVPNLIGNVLTFGRPLALVSVLPSDGSNLPKQYVYTDVLLSTVNNSFSPSAIAKINGIEVVKYLETFSELGPLTSPNALWNSLFISLASSTLASLSYTNGPGFFAGFGGGQFIYPGANTTLIFENGTTTVYENLARVLQPFQNITSGSDVLTQYVISPKSQPLTVAADLPTITSFPGYPKPVVIQSNGLVSGYYLDEQGYEDVAILSIPTFEAFYPFDTPSAPISFPDAAYGFIDQAKTDGKTKLIIDVSANGGGIIAEGYSLFIKLFPDLVPYLGQRIRATESVNLIGEAISAGLATLGTNLTSNLTLYEELSPLLSTPMNYRMDLDENNQHFPSWPAKYGPHTFHGDNFSSIFRYNESQYSLYDYTTASGRPFEAENIILLSDGACGSTCSIFAELLTRQGGVRTVAVGGRPVKGPMQALGSTKGANNIGWFDIFNYVNYTRALYTDQEAFNASQLGEYDQTPFKRGLPYSNSVNFRDQLRQNDTTQTPLQFVFEPADCRIWMTMPMVVDITALWEKVYDVTWGGKTCDADDSTLSKRGLTSRDQVVERDVIVPALTEQDVAFLQQNMNVWLDQRHAKKLGASLRS